MQVKQFIISTFCFLRQDSFFHKISDTLNCSKELTSTQTRKMQKLCTSNMLKQYELGINELEIKIGISEVTIWFTNMHQLCY